ncbi:MAG: hypothetical protein US96_C0035G0013 [Candidatus Woesebacteria bacterium GW2011_GWB1_38_5b]|uniref:Nudix hydrolase domain-containing protein n=1 Tax=Candidatus Woesebacteria bacterium GW2011_GWB1_38_5b TaxID=1618569 RepID=A0A0G0MKR3_9BACT|nr:MAG: hypothetical protein US96_C0035G0013 [Candidatus Woesebacteria bacterium GW2011_GWB1_38_5b]
MRTETELAKYSTDILVRELAQRNNLVDSEGRINSIVLDEIIIPNMPISCVDVIPVRHTERGYEIGIIKRGTGSQAGKLAIVGGRIFKDEYPNDAIRRHLIKDLNVHGFAHFGKATDHSPFFLQMYAHANSSQAEGYGFDPTKQAITLTYLVQIDEQPQPSGDEAIEYLWIDSEEQIPEDTAFNHGVAMRNAIRHLKDIEI